MNRRILTSACDIDLNIEDPILKLLNLDNTRFGVFGVGLVSHEFLPSPILREKNAKRICVQLREYYWAFEIGQIGNNVYLYRL